MPRPHAVLLTLLAAPLAARAGAQARDSASLPPRRVAFALAEVVALNLFVNRFDAWVLKADWAIQAGSHSWSRNLRLGWEWDEDHFGTNMFGHPFHGGTYFNSGRANGLDYWESAPLAFLGSWTWEYFGEAYRPSLNDFFMTSFGGIALGEMFHRVATSIRDNTARGGPRRWREIAALPIDPMGSLTRLVRGEWTARAPNPPEHAPGAFVLRVHAGARFLSDSSDADTVRSSPMVLADLRYGDPFAQGYRAPFDAFTVRAQFSGASLSQLRASGRLYGRDLNDSTARHRHAFAVNQRYDFVKNPAHQFGGQSVEAGLYSRWHLRGSYGIRTQLFADAIVLAALDAPSTGVGARLYDFGPGAGLRWDITLERRGITYVTLYGRTALVHTVSGASADHVVNFSGLELTVPVVRGLGLGLHNEYYQRVSRYTDKPDETRDFPEARVFLVWTSARHPGSGGGR